MCAVNPNAPVVYTRQNACVPSTPTPLLCTRPLLQILKRFGDLVRVDIVVRVHYSYAEA